MNGRGFFARNIDGRGRLLRALGALGLLGAALWIGPHQPWVGVAVGIAAAFVGFEALRGWCVLRACGIRTRL